ncbi:MAG: hypothetical protein IIC79_05635 [Chloroflexi bacterium]|nr:hypothetical protein [Chloroflexota bacterium]
MCRSIAAETSSRPTRLNSQCFNARESGSEPASRHAQKETRARDGCRNPGRIEPGHVPAEHETWAEIPATVARPTGVKKNVQQQS